MFTRLGPFAFGLALACVTATTAFAQPVPAPSETPILTVSGQLETTNVGDTVVFDANTLADLGTVTIETNTIWTEGVSTFEGVPLKTLVDLAGVDGGRLLASAINNYQVEIPVSDAVEGGPIIAFLMNGERMSVRDKGPLWVIYPYDQNADYRSEVTYSRSIWQVDRIEFSP